MSSQSSENSQEQVVSFLDKQIVESPDLFYVILFQPFEDWTKEEIKYVFDELKFTEKDINHYRKTTKTHYFSPNHLPDYYYQYLCIKDYAILKIKTYT